VGFAENMRAALAGYGEHPCIEFERTWFSGADIAHWIEDTEAALTDAGVAPGEAVGLVVRNRVPHAAVILGCIASGRPLSMIYSYQSDTAIAQDIRGLGLPAVIADRRDCGSALLDAAEATGSAVIALSPERPGAAALGMRSMDLIPTRTQRTEPGLEILTSGTTGPPKRFPIATAVLAHNVASMTLGQTVSPNDPPALVFWPFGSVGVCQLLAAAYSGQRIVLLEKFTVNAWVAAVKRHRVTWSGVQPTVVRMLLEANVPKEDLESLDYLPGGSGPLEPELQRRFEERYGIPLIWGYGATEFAGTVSSWTPQLRAQFGDSKIGSVGRPLPGVRVRILDVQTGDPVPTGEHGLLSAQVDALGPHWTTTTDIASLDEDGFLTVHGRSDGAVNRGGFKVLPERVRQALLTHSAVRDACVVGVPDARLGEVPFAVVELRPEHSKPSEEVLKDVVRENLPAPNVPVRILCVDELPRNAVMKVRLDAVRALYATTSSPVN
jgi:acyl-coenzyme A synthetase/AMP-(fatty) acid ligase